MISSWGVIGASVGVLLGITGSGGAIIAIPLFIHLANTTLKDATVLSLIAVVTGASLNWIVQKKNTIFKYSFSIFAFSTLGSMLFIPLKEKASESMILTAFAGVALVSLISIWQNEPEQAVKIKAGKPEISLLKLSAGGFTLGALTTMTGLGGGVVIIPFLKSVCHLSFSQATATSLLTILLSSIFNLLIQHNVLTNYLTPIPILTLVGGSLISALFTHQLIRLISAKKLNQVRRILITGVLLISIAGLFYRS